MKKKIIASCIVAALTLSQASAFAMHEPTHGETEETERYMQLYADTENEFEDNAELFALSSGDYEYTINLDGTVAIADYTGSDTEITIPSEIDGKKVTSIGGYAFSWYSSLESVEIPDSVTSIGSSAFRYCSSLASIKIPDGVTSIGYYAFSGTALYNNEENWEDGVLYIGKHLIDAKEDISGEYTIKNGTITIAGVAFSDCSSLESITIPNSVTSIGGYAFSGCSSLESITLPNSVTSIGSSVFKETALYENEENWEDNVLYIGKHLIDAKEDISGEYEIKDGTHTIAVGAFFGCRSLESITIPNSVTSIGTYAFSGCRSLESVEIPDSVTSIGRDAFSGCSSLESIAIPNSVTSINSSAFSGCSSVKSFTVSENNQYYTSVDGVLFNKEMTELMCYPDGADNTGYTISDSVTSIGEYAFSGCSSLESITLPNSVTSIGERAFSWCSKLESITIPDSVTIIENEVFYDCSSLESVTVPDSVTSIGESAFSWCSKLENITISDSVTSIGRNAFYETALYENEENWEDDILYIGKHLIKAKEDISGEYEIKDGTLTIADYAFEDCSSLESVEIPDSVTSIGRDAFSGCSSLKSITLSDSVTSIGEYAFSGCSGLKSITLSDSVTIIENRVFYGCSSLTSITIPDSVTSIGGSAFSGCYKLTIYGYENSYAQEYANKKNIPFSVVGENDGKIEDYEYTINLDSDTITITKYTGTDTEITIPSEFDGKKVTSIGGSAFSGCSSLTSVTIPGGVTSIGFCTFYDCSSLEGVTIPNSVTSIGRDAFYGTALYNNEENWENGVLYIGKHLIKAKVRGECEIKKGTVTIVDCAFWQCSSLESVTIPNSVTSIGLQAFEYCTSLKSVTIPNGVTSIGAEAFGRCWGMESITISDSVTSIGYGAFVNCISLENVTIPGGVTSIVDKTFEDCGGLKSVTIPNSVTSIGWSAFSGCSSVKSFTVSENNQYYTSVDGVLFNKEMTEIMRYPAGAKSTEYIIPGGVTRIGSGAFSGCSSLASITIPGSVTSIGYYAFSGTALYNNEENWEDSVLYIGKYLIEAEKDISGEYEIKSGTIMIADSAFSECHGLDDITFPDSVTSIGDNAFFWCTGLKSITIPGSVTSIDVGAFVDCWYLTSITIPDSVTSIGEHAFSACDNLTIYGYENSYAQEYANDNDIPFSVIINFNDVTLDKPEVSYENGKVEVKVTINTEKNSGFKVYAAVYDDNGKMIGIKKVNVSDKSVTIDVTGKPKKVKVFAFKTADGASPLCENQEITDI